MRFSTEPECVDKFQLFDDKFPILSRSDTRGDIHDEADGRCGNCLGVGVLQISLPDSPLHAHFSFLSKQPLRRPNTDARKWDHVTIMQGAPLCIAKREFNCDFGVTGKYSVLIVKCFSVLF
jgi:hypothetical protein